MGNEENRTGQENIMDGGAEKDPKIELVLEEEPAEQDAPDSKIELVLDSDSVTIEKPDFNVSPEELETPDTTEAATEASAQTPAEEPSLEETAEAIPEEPSLEEPFEGIFPEEEPVKESHGILDNGVEQLEEIRTAIAELARTEQEYKETDRSLKAKKKELDVQKKRVEEKIAAAVKKARTDLERQYDEEINTAEKSIKDAETRKKAAKSAAVNERMKRENSSLVDENKVLSAEIKTAFKEAEVPGFCRSSLYYSLFQPKKQKDYLICAIGILICAGVIPFLVTRFVSTTFLKVLVWIIIAVCFAAIYFLIAAWTKKGNRNLALVRMRSSIDQIAANKQFIKKRNKNIKADPDESQYNLYEYDQLLESARADLETARTEKEQALLKFENEDSVKLRSEMEEEKAPMFQQLEKEIEQMSEDLNVRSESYQEASRVMEEFNHAFGDKGIKADKLEDLINIINEGKAATIWEALDVQKNK